MKAAKYVLVAVLSAFTVLALWHLVAKYREWDESALVSELRLTDLAREHCFRNERVLPAIELRTVLNSADLGSVEMTSVKNSECVYHFADNADSAFFGYAAVVASEDKTFIAFFSMLNTRLNSSSAPSAMIAVENQTIFIR